MEFQDTVRENEVVEIEPLLQSLTESDWEEAGWPVISSASKESYINSITCDSEHVRLWEQVLNKKNFIIPEVQNTYNPKKDNLFIIHSFEDENGNECIFKAVTTSLNSFSRDPKNMINYTYNGKPQDSVIRNRSGKGCAYPTCNFWNDFYDKLSEDKLGAYPIPTREWRKKFILSKYFNK